MENTIYTEIAKLGLPTNVKLTNSFGLDVHATGFLELDSIETLHNFAVSDYFTSGLPYTILSGGNNIIFCGDYDGVVLYPATNQIEIIEDQEDGVKVRVGAGIEWDDLVEWSVDNKLWGLENLSLIPGKVGAAPIQNIGAYGSEAKDCVYSVETFDLETKQMRYFSNEQCNFGYRESIFKLELKSKVVVMYVVFELSRVPNPRLGYGDLEREVMSRGGASLANIRDSVIQIRSSKLPDTSELGNAGSFFKNPVVARSKAEALLAQYENMPSYTTDDPNYIKLAAGWLIEKAGLKGTRQANVGVHTKQALVLVNYGGASGREIITFAEQIRAQIKDKFGIDLEFEVNIIR